MKIVEDNEKSFKVQRKDGQVVHIAKTPETASIYKLCKGGMTGYAQGGLIQEVAQLAPLAMLALKDGGKVPGKAKVEGDSPKNDTVDAKLSPGEMVIPRTVVAKGPEAIAKFVQEALAGKHPPHIAKDSKLHADDGAGPVPPPNVYQQTVDDELPEAPTPAQFQGTPSVAGQPAPQLDESDTGLTGGSGTAQAQEATPPEQSFGVMADNRNPAPPPPPSAGEGGDKNVDGNNATPETPGSRSGGSGYDPYKPFPSTSVTDSSTSRPELKGALSDFNDAIASNQRAQVEAGTREMELKGELAKRQAQVIQDENVKQDAFNQQRNQEIDARLKQVKDVTNQFLGMKIDSHRMYGDGQTGNKIMAGIGLLLGAFGQGLSGNQSPVPGIIEKAIDRDINVQKANIEKAGKNVELLSGGLKDYMNVTDDMATAMAAEKARHMDLVAKQFDQYAAANSSPIVKAQASQQAMAFREKALQSAGQVQENVHSKVVQTMLPKLDPQNPDEVNKMHANVEVQAKTEHMVDMLNSGLFSSGPWDGRKAKIAARFGLENRSEADFLQNFSQVKDQIVHDIASARGLQPEAMKNFTALAGDITTNKDALVSYLTNLNQQASGENDMIARTNRENRRFPMDLQGARDTYDKSNPQLYGSKRLGITPKRGK